MSHVDEGTLHAYLDHGDRPMGDRREVEDHLATCAHCRQRLDDARSLRERAAAILEASGPPAVPVPPFDSVLARAGGRAPRPVVSVRRLRALGWAASIALAVGVGWMARGALNPLRSPEESLTAPAAPTATFDSALPSAAAGARVGEPSALGEEQAAPAAAARARNVEDAAERLRSAYEVTEEAKPSGEGAAGRRDALQRNAAEPFQPAPQEAPAAAAPQAKLAQDIGAVAERREQPIRTRAAELEAAPTTVQWVEADSVEAAGRLGEALHMVPGVPVVRIDREALEDSRAVRIVQDLDGIPLEIAQRPVTALERQLAERMVADAPGMADTSRATITIVRGSVVLTLRANIAPDSLRSLAARIP